MSARSEEEGRSSLMKGPLELLLEEKSGRKKVCVRKASSSE